MKVMGIGSPLVDLLALVSDEFLANIAGEKGGMELVELERIEDYLKRHNGEIELQSGGGAANTIYALARLGLPCSFLGKVGNDSLAQSFIRQFEDAGIATTHFRKCVREGTGRCLSMVTPDTQRTLRTYLGAASQLQPEELTLKDFTGFTHVYLEAYLAFNPPLAERAATLAKEAGCTVSLGLSSFEVVRLQHALLEPLLRDVVDVVFANSDEACAFAESDDPRDGLAALSERCEVVAVTLGEEGALVQRGGETRAVPAVAAEAVDTTGAGDLWAAGFLYGILHNMTLNDSARLAAFLGGRAVEQQGAKLPEKSWKEAKKWVMRNE